ncbi:MAG TPA: hypothetical protein VGY13_06905 [Solirubrobacteraceae bacterium]|nr:hypothetical protein [Solirubrobacteraceae bacterium]
MYAHALAAGGVVGDVAVLDRVVQDRRELVEHFADRACGQRHRGLALPVADLGAGRDRLAQLPRLLELVGLERQAQVGVDLVEAVVGEERQQMALDLPAVLLLCVRADRLGAEHPVDLCLQPLRGVLTERRHRTDGDRLCRRPLRGCDPDARLDPGEDVLELDGGGALVPGAPAAAAARAPLVQAHRFAFAVRAEAQTEAQRAVSECLGRDRACRRARHQPTPSRARAQARRW